MAVNAYTPSLVVKIDGEETTLTGDDALAHLQAIEAMPGVVQQTTEADGVKSTTYRMITTTGGWVTLGVLTDATTAATALAACEDALPNCPADEGGDDPADEGGDDPADEGGDD